MQVGEALDRVSSWPRHKLSRDLDNLVKETKAAQRQIFGGGNQMPCADQLSAIGRTDLRQAIIRAGDFLGPFSLQPCIKPHRLAIFRSITIRDGTFTLAARICHNTLPKPNSKP